MVKISNLPAVADANLSLDDFLAMVDLAGNVTDKATLQQLITFFFNNIPSGTIPGSVFDHVISGGVWSGDAYASTRNASMTAISVYINNRTIAISAVTARTFTASRDTYIDILDNLDGTGTLVYTEVANNAASPALAANSIRIGIIVTAAGSIAAVGSVNQGEVEKIVPIVSSIAYTVTDSLGNLICPRDPQRKVLGYRRTIANHNFNGAESDVLGVSVPFILPTTAAGRKIHASGNNRGFGSGVAGDNFEIFIKETTTQLAASGSDIPTGGAAVDTSCPVDYFGNPTVGLHTYKLSVIRTVGSGTCTYFATATAPGFLAIEFD